MHNHYLRLDIFLLKYLHIITCERPLHETSFPTHVVDPLGKYILHGEIHFLPMHETSIFVLHTWGNTSYIDSCDFYLLYPNYHSRQPIHVI